VPILTYDSYPLNPNCYLQTLLFTPLMLNTESYILDEPPQIDQIFNSLDLGETTPEWIPERLSPRLEEQRLLEIVQELDLAPFQKIATASNNAQLQVICISSGRAQAAEWFARSEPNSHVTCWYLDQFQAFRASEHMALPDEKLQPARELPANLEIACTADLPLKEYQLAFLPLVSSGEAELSRDFLQQMFHQLSMGGRLIVSVDNPEDRWVHEQMKGFEKSVKVRKFIDAVVYMIDKKTPLKKLKDFSCELAFRDCEDLIQLITRPGVFSHRQLDNGARQLLDAVDVYPGARLLDIGCGSGSVTLGIAKRDSNAKVHAVDSNARSLSCLSRSLELNGIKNVTMELNHTGVYGEPDQFDMALANPPYFGDFRIAEKFIVAAHRSMRSSGRLVLVTKQPNWYRENLERWLIDCDVFESRRYHIVSGVKP